MNSKKIYDSIAGNYEEIRSRRLLYHQAVDGYISSHPSYNSFKKVLDIGSGDGSRISNLFDSDTSITVLEESHEMCEILRRVSRFENVLEMRAEDLGEVHNESAFDLVTMQWNVMGHIDNHLSLLNFCFNSLNIGGRLIFDVNNPINLRQYGVKSVMSNLFYFFLYPRRKRRLIRWQISNMSTEVGFSPPSYYVKLLKSAGFGQVNKIYLDYEDGSSTNKFFGQIVIEGIKT
jgi:SAM-dependent methyltransferase